MVLFKFDEEVAFTN